MADVTKIGNLTVIAAADIADATHPINTPTGSQFNDQAGITKVLGRMYLRDNGGNDYDLVIPITAGATGLWMLVESGTNVTPS
jgi:hypothetical protein